MTFPPGNGGLSTMRLVCTLESPLATPLAAPTAIAFEDRFEPTRIGWREMTVTGSAMTISDTDLPAESPTARLTTYPSPLSSAPDIRTATFTATPGGPTLAALRRPRRRPHPPDPPRRGGGGGARGTLPPRRPRAAPAAP